MPVRDLLMSAGGASAPATYIEDVFSTYLYTGTGATQSINNGIDLAGKGGMTWIKNRNGTFYNTLFDTARGASNEIYSNVTSAQDTNTATLNSFNSNGFSLGSNAGVNNSGSTYASWTFRKQPKFFDVVQYTGNGVAGTTINHSLGSVPGMIIIKRLSTGGDDWPVYHSALGNSNIVFLNKTNASGGSISFNNTTPTSTVFTIGGNAAVNASGDTYIAYLFASNAGGFGTAGTDNVISCGTYSRNGSASTNVNLGFEPQWIITKRVDSTGNWEVEDNMRGFPAWPTGYGNTLFPNTSGSEAAENSTVAPNATGFNTPTGGSAATYIYMAIRRLMKPPTTGTSVFSPVVATPSGTPNTVTTNFPVDLNINKENSYNASGGVYVWDRLRGTNQSGGLSIKTNNPNAENTEAAGFGFDNNTAIVDAYNNSQLGISDAVSYWNFRRAPTFFDEVCYTGTGSATTQTHNLTVAPELIIVKDRSSSNDWWVYHSTTGNTKYSVLNTTAIPVTSSTAWNNTTPTSSVFSIGTGASVNTSGDNYVAYLFATCSGVSKVGSFTGTGATQTINCGFGSGGARFILIKRTDSTGDWYCYDSANGLTSSSSPYLLWDSTAAQVTGNNGVYASSGGFTLGATASTTTNISTATYIFLAIA